MTHYADIPVAQDSWNALQDREKRDKKKEKKKRRNKNSTVMSVDAEKDHEAQPAAPTSPPTQQSITANPTAADPPPDGGLHAWLQVLVGHLTVFNSFGQINSFGIYQSHYTSTLALSPSTISWIGSLQILLIYGVGALSGRALDAGHFRPTLALGLALQVLGTFATSAAEGAYWRLLLAQGVCQGLGMGLAFCPAVANAATYFARRRVVAISCVACGGATGGMVFPAIAQTLLGRVGFAWTVRVIGFVVLFNAAVILALARTRGQRVAVVGDGGGAPLIDWAAFRETPYLLYCVSMFFAFWGIWLAYYYVSLILFVDERCECGADIPARSVPTPETSSTSPTKTPSI